MDAGRVATPRTPMSELHAATFPRAGRRSSRTPPRAEYPRPRRAEWRSVFSPIRYRRSSYYPLQYGGTHAPSPALAGWPKGEKFGWAHLPGWAQLSHTHTRLHPNPTLIDYSRETWVNHEWSGMGPADFARAHSSAAAPARGRNRKVRFWHRHVYLTLTVPPPFMPSAAGSLRSQRGALAQLRGHCPTAPTPK